MSETVFDPTPALVDTHAHLDDPRFEGEVEALLARARAAGVIRVVTIGVDPETSRRAVELARKYPFDVSAAVGVSPHDAGTYDEAVAAELESLAGEPGVVAWGEIGLDYHHDRAPREVQRRVFLDQLRRARDQGLPAVVHCREAHADLAGCLEEAESYPGLEEPPRGVLHCFSGTADDARRAVALGYMIGIGGVVTFANAGAHREVVRSLPPESVVLETDAPYLAPQPHRGKRNEPAYVRLTAERVAELHGAGLGEIAPVTTANARRLFRLPEPEGFGGAPAYALGRNLYLNPTSRCTNDCAFCVRRRRLGLGGYRLWLDREPGAGDLIEAVGDPASYDEVVFCGFGEPLLSAQIVAETARWLKERGARVRVNTNGTAHLARGETAAGLLEPLRGLVDEFSVSLNAADAAGYVKICRPVFGEAAFTAVLDFTRTAVGLGFAVTASAVALPDTDLAPVERLAAGLGARFRARTYKND
ncbi:MAG TPA: TatD family hydrolase [bacterium]|nr:TatD family hydrolase [bacterium]